MGKNKKDTENNIGIYSLNNETTTIKKTQTTVPPNNQKIIYTILGQQKKLEYGFPALELAQENSDLAYAKQKLDKYFIKLDDEGKLFNPISASPNTTDHKFKMMKKQGSDWQWIKVQQDCFEQYINFLRTKNPLYLKHAERIRQ